MYRQITLNKETFVGPLNVCFQEEDGIWKSLTKKVFKRSTDPVSSGNDDMKLENKCSAGPICSRRHEFSSDELRKSDAIC